MSGTFNANEPEAFVRFLGDDESLLIEQRGSEIVVKER